MRAPQTGRSRARRRWLLHCGALLGALLLMASWPSRAQGTAACPPLADVPTLEQIDAGAGTARNRGFLWRISKAGHSSYLYGTVHVARRDWVSAGPDVMDALRASDVIALELDVLDNEVRERLRAGMAWRADRAVDAALMQRLRKQLQLACLPEALLSAMTPEMVASTLMIMAGRHEGLDPAYAVDVALAQSGKGMKKPVSSLETPELQLAALQAATARESQLAVEQALDELESRRAAPMLVRIAQVWAEGRLDELERYTQWCNCVRSDEERALYGRLLDERNPGLARGIDALHMSGKRVFAAIGSLHLVGPRGLAALLAERGYQVERVALK